MDHKERIMKAGLELFSSRSYHQVGIREIAKLVEMPTGSFHYYFKNKEDFTAAVLDYFFETEIVPDFAKISNDGSLNAKQKVIAYFSSRINHYLTAGNESNCIVSCVMGNLGQDVALQSEIISGKLQSLVNEQIIAGLVRIIVSGQEAKSIKTEIKAAVLAPMIFNAYEGSMIQRKINHNNLPLNQFLDFLEQLL